MAGSIQKFQNTLRPNRLNGLAKASQAVPPRPRYALGVNSPSSAVTDGKSLTDAGRGTEGPIIIVLDFCAKNYSYGRRAHTHTFMHTRERCSWWKNSAANVVIQQSDRD